MSDLSTIEQVRVRETYLGMDDLILCKWIEKVDRVSLTFNLKDKAAWTIRILASETSRGTLSKISVEQVNRVSAIEKEKTSKCFSDQIKNRASFNNNQKIVLIAKNITQRAIALKVHKSCHRGEKVRWSRPCRAVAVMTRVTHDG